MSPEQLVNHFTPLYLNAKSKQGVSQQDIDAFQICLQSICQKQGWLDAIVMILNKHPIACLNNWVMMNTIITKIYTVFFKDLRERYATRLPQSNLVQELNNTVDLDDCLIKINEAIRSMIMGSILNALDFDMLSHLRSVALKHLINSFDVKDSDKIKRDYNDYLQAAPTDLAREYIKGKTSKYLILIDVGNTSARNYAELFIDLNTLSVTPFLKLYERLPHSERQLIKLLFAKFPESILANHTVIDSIVEKLIFVLRHFPGNLVVKIQNIAHPLIQESHSLLDAEYQLSKTIQEFIRIDLPRMYELSNNEAVLTQYVDGFESNKRNKLRRELQRLEIHQVNAKEFCIGLIVLCELFDKYAVYILNYYSTLPLNAAQNLLASLKTLNYRCALLSTNEFKQIFIALLHQYEEILYQQPEKILTLLIQLACLDLENEKELVEAFSTLMDYSACMNLINTKVHCQLLNHFIFSNNQPERSLAMLTKYNPLLLTGFIESLDPAKSKIVWQEYQRFAMQYEKADDHAAPGHQTPYNTFIQANQATFLKLFHVFDIALFPFLKSYLGTSTLKLIRFFAQVDGLNADGMKMIKLCLAKWPPHSTYDHKLLENLCIAGSSMQLLLPFDNNQFQKVTVACTIAPSFNAALEMFSEFITHSTANKLRIPQSTAKLQAFPFEKLTRLLVAAKSMEKDRFEEMYYAMLLADFSPNEDFNTFVSGNFHNSELSKRLAAHNAAIKILLKNGGIDISILKNYPKSATFTLNCVAGDIDFIGLFQSVWQFINTLESKLTQLPKEFAESKIVKESLKSIEKVKSEILKGNQAFSVKLERIKMDSVQKLIRKMTDKIKKFKRDDPQLLNLNPLRSVYEFNDHVDQSLTQLINATAKISNVKRIGLFHQKTFHLEVWDKNKIDTLFLGDYVSCCLATDGTHFPAMVQRRMDEGLFFIVVMDETINEPVALSWLFYGADTKTPNDIYVVANFFEIKPSLGFNLTMRHALLSRLLYYTDEFATKIKSKGLLIQPLTYGLMQNDLDFLPKVSMRIKKVGGSFHPTDVAKHLQTQNLYYLTSLGANEFQRFDAKIVAEKFPVPLRVIPQTSNIPSQARERPLLPGDPELRLGL